MQITFWILTSAGGKIIQKYQYSEKYVNISDMFNISVEFLCMTKNFLITLVVLLFWFWDNIEFRHIFWEEFSSTH